MENKIAQSMIPLNRDNHPCFNKHAQKTHMRVHLPVAPKCNIQCNYCNRKYSCMNENRPGVTGNILSPHQALFYMEKLYEKNKSISVVGIAGPGDAMANAQETFETLQLIRNRGIPVLFCLATNGLKLYEYIDDIVNLKVSHVTVTVNAVDAKIGESIYAWVRDGIKIYRGLEAAELLYERQMASIKKLSDLGVTVKVNSILIPGVNDHHIPDVAEKVHSLGASIFNVMPLYPIGDTAFEFVEAPSKKLVADVQKKCAEFMPMMMHCQRCRSDAAGFLHEGIRTDFKDTLDSVSKMSLNPYQKKEHVAVASSDGESVNVHLGQASDVIIYQQDGDSYKQMEVRTMPQEGGGDERWMKVVDLLEDCKCLVVSHVGKRPQEVLKKQGINVYESNAEINAVLPKIFDGAKNLEELFVPKGCSGPESFGFENEACDTKLACSEKGCNGCGGSAS